MARKKKNGLLVTALAAFGYVVTEDVVAGWTPEQVAMVRDSLAHWDTYTPDKGRVTAPEWLEGFDLPDGEALAEARAVGAEWKKLNPDADADAANPWPEGSKLFYSWADGVAFGEKPADDLPDEEFEIIAGSDTAAVPEATGQAEVVASDPVEAALAVAQQQTEVKKPAPVAVSRPVAPAEKPRKLAKPIMCSTREAAALKIAYRLSDLTPTVNEAEAEYIEAKGIADKAKKVWEGLQKQMQGVSTELSQILSGGEFQLDLYASGNHSSEALASPLPPHAEVHEEYAEQAPAAAAPAVVLVDHGGALDLSCLGRKALAAIGSDTEGLTDSKIELLKSSIEGSTIAHLEEVQRTNPYWNRDVKGFGEKWIDRLSDAQLAVRLKYPIPVEYFAEPAPAEAAAEVNATAETQGSPPETDGAVEAEKAEALDNAVDDAVETQAELVEAGELVAVGAEADDFGEDMPD
ncbi:MAG: hypothetical protein V4719_00945 [Planctomycetota bacterium]